MTDQYDLDRLYLDIFETDQRGAAIFDDLFRRFGRGGVVTNGGIDAVLQTYQRAARREVLDYIVTRCNRARGVDDAIETPQADA